MKQVRGFFLPDDEHHLVPFLETGPEFACGATYQLHKLMAAMPYVKNFRHACDIGGHCGLWSRPLSVMFHHVTAFEPVARHRECWYANVTNGRAELKHCALGDREGTVSLHSGDNSSGDTYVQDGGEHAADIRTLDSFNLEHLDFLKADCEGFEYFALKGGEATIRKWQPCVIVEQKPGRAEKYGLGRTDAVTLLQSWGAKLRNTISGDYILSW